MIATLGVGVDTMMTYQQKHVLKKYRQGRIIDKGDEDAVEYLTSVGLMRCGYNDNKKRATAKTTPLGRDSVSFRLFW
ncbi:hypothetical protein [Candidatus Methanomassiliicoccus intestinalis]|uniref:Uncharacterized protein n=2 Tax=Candidatus Methanomassiliicoccus intestinalis TaxID=1406512 RepID=R9TAC7_METII|nr:hypothetical protein [Candidatus Methanomassiliicoccus intestinalis]AGN26338.1 hypothetical protein MMINT_09880 [Candidatus Methanomassiliicoccus intestinalis Issoire-Mx1]